MCRASPQGISLAHFPRLLALVALEQLKASASLKRSLSFLHRGVEAREQIQLVGPRTAGTTDALFTSTSEQKVALNAGTSKWFN